MPAPREAPPSGAIAIASALHAFTLLIARQVTYGLESLDAEIDFHVVPPLCPLIGSPYDFSHTSELIERAAASTDAWLANGGLERRIIPGQLRAHSHAV
jgi:NTE family protein